MKHEEKYLMTIIQGTKCMDYIPLESFSFSRDASRGYFSTSTGGFIPVYGDPVYLFRSKWLIASDSMIIHAFNSDKKIRILVKENQTNFELEGNGHIVNIIEKMQPTKNPNEIQRFTQLIRIEVRLYEILKQNDGITTNKTKIGEAEGATNTNSKYPYYFTYRN